MIEMLTFLILQIYMVNMTLLSDIVQLPFCKSSIY